MYFCFECFTRPYCLLRHQYFSYVMLTHKPMGFKQGAIRLADTIRKACYVLFKWRVKKRKKNDASYRADMTRPVNQTVMSNGNGTYNVLPKSP